MLLHGAVDIEPVRRQQAEGLLRQVAGLRSQNTDIGLSHRGIDVGVKQAMYQLIYELKTKGYSFVLISEELPELIGMSDRILILKDGCVAGEYSRSETLSEHDLIQVMV